MIVIVAQGGTGVQRQWVPTRCVVKALEGLSWRTAHLVI